MITTIWTRRPTCGERGLTFRQTEKWSSNPQKTMPEIREIKASERHFLDEILREAAYFPDPSKKQEKLTKLHPVLSSYFENFGREGEIALVVETAEGLGGAAWTRRFSNEVSSHGYVDDETPELGIAIKEEWGNRGTGTRLITRIIGELSAAGFNRVSFSVDKRNPVVRLYHRLGFHVHSEGSNFDTMVKNIEPPVIAE
ncbi:MAG: GNAT family N-acetyltransferase [Acidobacteriota bacterium]